MNSQAREWVNRFHRHLVTERRVSPHTVSNYGRDLAALIAFCDHERLEEWPAIEVKHVRVFAARSYARGLSPQSVQRRLSAVRTFMKFLIREGVIGANFAALVRAPKAARKLPAVLDADQMTRLIEIPGDHWQAIRDRAVMELLYSSALRLAELTHLNCGDVDFADQTVTVLGKGNKTRIVPVGRLALTALRRWLNVRARIAKEGEKALFVSRRGGRIGRRVVQARIAYWGRRQGIAVRVHPHMFRHSCATHLLESSGQLREVSEFLGHASLSTTGIYTHLDVSHLAKVYDATHPRAHRVRDKQ